MSRSLSQRRARPLSCDANNILLQQAVQTTLPLRLLCNSWVGRVGLHGRRKLARV